MFNMTKAARRLFIAAGLSVIAASANAFVLGIDPQIMIDRAIDSPTLTVRYKGVAASLVELKINGSSVGTRSVESSGNSGETNFVLNLGDLHEGDNEVQIRIFDRTGKLVAEDKTNISTAPAQAGPVFLAYPKTGATVQGPVEIKAGFDQELKDCYVSFFVDGTFKSMTNYPPFNYSWDTERETNGWHELEAWAIDDSSNTHKTGKVRVFVNNRHGDTPRFGNSPDLNPSINAGSYLKIKTATRPLHANVTKLIKNPAIRALADMSPLPAAAPSITAEPVVLGSASKRKPMTVATEGIAMGPRTFLPTGKKHPKAEASLTVSKPVVAPRSNSKPESTSNVNDTHPGMVVSVKRHLDDTRTYVAKAGSKQAGAVVKIAEAESSLVNLTRGSRLPNLSSFYIALDSDFVDFHGVMPRVDDGVPMTPVRFLLEKKGGLVTWDNPSKTMFAKTEGNGLKVHIGDPFAFLNGSNIGMERASYLDQGRTILPLSFLEKALNVKIQYDKNSNHVLITSHGK